MSARGARTPASLRVPWSTAGTGPTWLLLEKVYRARGFSRRLMKSMASSRLLTVTMGRMGPKISSCITGSVSCTSTSTVGAARAQDGSAPGVGPRAGPRDRAPGSGMF